MCLREWRRSFPRKKTQLEELGVGRVPPSREFTNSASVETLLPRQRLRSDSSLNSCLMHRQTDEF